MTWEIKVGDALEVLRTMPDESVHMVCTSPPYWGLRDYRVEGQLGLERTPEEYIANMVAVFREVRRVLRSDGTCWINIGDSYNANYRWGGDKNVSDKQWSNRGTNAFLTPQSDAGTADELSGLITGSTEAEGSSSGAPPNRCSTGTYAGCEAKSAARLANVKPKDLVGIPWMLAFALRGDGWWLRQDIIWSKPSPMPESVTDRCTKAHEYVFLLTKSARYFYDAEAVKEDAVTAQDDGGQDGRGGKTSFRGQGAMRYQENGRANRNGRQMAEVGAGVTRNKRSVWEIATSPFPEAHFATYPPKLVEPCILAGCPEGGTVLDPFSGAGTTGLVATRLGRSFIGIELNADYAAMARRRITADTPLFNTRTTLAN